MSYRFNDLFFSGECDPDFPNMECRAHAHNFLVGLGVRICASRALKVPGDSCWFPERAQPENGVLSTFG